MSDDQDPMRIVMACVIVVFIILAGAAIVVWLRKRFLAPIADETSSGGFTLGDLRRLHKSGRMSEEEFNKAKAAIVLAAQRAAQRPSPDAAKTSGPTKPRPS